jgi:hypothetical protein
MDTQVLVAMISGLFALLVAGVALMQSRRSEAAQRSAQVDLESLKATLAAELAEGNALRDYEYDARRRLYSEVGPLVFQLTELSDAAILEIGRLCNPSHWHRLSLTEASRESLRARGWIGSTSYDTVFAAYALLAPLASFRFLQRRLSALDIALDRRAWTQWMLLRSLYEMFSRDEEIAALHPSRDYDPRVADWRERRQADPAKYWWQGVTRGRLDNAIELVVEDDGRGPPRLRTFGEFESTFKEAAATANDYEKALGAFANPLFDFHPGARPVYWRMLAIQAVLHKGLRHVGRHLDATPQSSPLAQISFDDDLERQFDVDGAEPCSVVAGVVDAYLDTYVRPALADRDSSYLGQ